MENIHKLREAVLEAITGVIQGVKTNQQVSPQRSCRRVSTGRASIG